MPSVFALLVGINTYHKDSGVSSLNGCVNDIDVMRDYIRTNFSQDAESNIVCLKNEQATRSAVVENFKNHLIKNPGVKEGEKVVTEPLINAYDEMIVKVLKEEQASKEEVKTEKIVSVK